MASTSSFVQLDVRTVPVGRISSVFEGPTKASSVGFGFLGSSAFVSSLELALEFDLVLFGVWVMRKTGFFSMGRSGRRAEAWDACLGNFTLFIASFSVLSISALTAILLFFFLGILGTFEIGSEVGGVGLGSFFLLKQTPMGFGERVRGSVGFEL